MNKHINELRKEFQPELIALTKALIKKGVLTKQEIKDEITN